VKVDNYIVGHWEQDGSAQVFRALKGQPESRTRNAACKWIKSDALPGDYDIIVRLPGSFNNAEQLEFGKIL